MAAIFREANFDADDTPVETRHERARREDSTTSRGVALGDADASGAGLCETPSGTEAAR